MFGTIRKHQKWLWAVIVTATVLSFVAFFNPSSRLSGGGGGHEGPGNYGSIAGEQITSEEFYGAQKEVALRYFSKTAGAGPTIPRGATPILILTAKPTFGCC